MHERLTNEGSIADPGDRGSMQADLQIGGSLLQGLGALLLELGRATRSVNLNTEPVRLSVHLSFEHLMAVHFPAVWSEAGRGLVRPKRASFRKSHYHLGPLALHSTLKVEVSPSLGRLKVQNRPILFEELIVFESCVLQFCQVGQIAINQGFSHSFH